MSHDQRGTIDLVIASTLFINSISKYYVKQGLDCTSNHQRIDTIIEYDGHYKSQKPSKRFWPNQKKKKSLCFTWKNKKI